MTNGELYAIFDARFPLAGRAEWDNDGWMVGMDATRPVRRVLCTLDVTERAIACAKERACDVIVSHHPLIFHPLASLDGQSVTARRAVECAAAGITVFSFHTRADAAVGGVNDALAEALGVTDTRPFGACGEEMGRVGRLPSPMTGDEFCAHVKRALHAPIVTANRLCARVERVALLGGSGGDFIDAALAAGADAFVTGEAGYNRQLDAADAGLMVVTAGHFHTENPIVARFASIVRDAAPECEVFTFDSYEGVTV